jgi:hypothetical protein
VIRRPFEALLSDLFLGPDEGLSFVVICVDVGIDVLLELFEACRSIAAIQLKAFWLDISVARPKRK